MTALPLLASTREELQDVLAPAREKGPVAFVPTMGALHAGHAALMDAARDRTDGPVVVSVFVNPLQFGEGEDLDRYPRTLETDLELCGAHGVDVVFAPAVEEVYPGGEPQVTVEPGPLATVLEGRSRPGHFRGVLTVVAKLLGLVDPDVAVFGEKDYQQLTLVRRMVADLCLGVEVVGVPTVREDDGLAMSSRNRYLDPEQRLAAAHVNLVLRAARGASAWGYDVALEAARAELRAAHGVDLDYLEITGTDLQPLPDDVPAGTTGRILIAARVGSTRLIDNMPLVLGRRSPRTSGTERQPGEAGRRSPGRRPAERSEALMLRTMMKSKIHRATVTQADLHYVGSVTVDQDLLDAADLLPGELVHIVDVTNGARLETYTIAGERGSGVIGINGAAARLVHPGDVVILIGYGQMETAEAREHQPHVVFVDADNRVMATGADPAETFGDPSLSRGDLARH